MRNKKLLKFIIVCSLLLLVNIKNSYALEEVPTKLVEYITYLFEETKGYDIIDSDSNSVKERFLKENINDYNNKNIKSIYNKILENNFVLTYENETNNLLRASRTVNLTKNFLHTYRFDSVTSVTFEVECYATIRVNDNTGEITSFSGPSVSLNYTSGGLFTSSKLYDVNTSYSWGSSAHRSINFNYKYGLEVVEKGSWGQATTYKTPTYTQTIHGE